MPRCAKCRRLINPDHSSYVGVAQRLRNTLSCEVVKASRLPDGGVFLHLNGDRECGKEISGYKRKILEELDLPVNTVTDPLDFI